MTKKRLILTVLLCCLCVFNLSAQSSKGLPVKTIDQLQDTLERILINEHQSALMLAVVTRDSVLLAKGFGYANIDTKQPATGQTLFPMASITKTFTALAIMKLVKQGKLSLHDKLSAIAPEIKYDNPWEKTHPLKVIHLLEHTSGFDDLRFNTFWNNDLNITELQAIEKCRNSMHCRWRPGEREAYCNIDYNILGYLIEKRSGLPYDSFLKKEILLPIGMTNSNFITPIGPHTSYAYPYEWDNGKYKRLPVLQAYGKGAGALYSCADDMAKFVQYMLNNGSGDLDQMEIPESTPAAQLGLKTGYGKGITVDYLNDKFPFYGHDGTNIGFFSRYAYNRNLQAGFVVCGSNPREVADIIVHYFTDSLRAPEPVKTMAVDQQILRSYEGYYQLKSPRFELLNTYMEELLHGYHIALRGDSLYAYGFKRPDQVLLPVTEKIFTRPHENAPSFVFTKNSEGQSVLYEWGAYYEKTSYTKILLTQIAVVGGLVSGILLLLSAIFWLFRAMFRKLTWKEFRIRSLSAFGVLWLAIAFGVLAYLSTHVSLMGSVNMFTLVFFLGTVMFALLSVAGFVMAVKWAGKTTNIWTRVYWLVTTGWLLALVAYFFHYGWIGIRMWSY